MPFITRQSSAGPVVWASIFTATCLLLFFFQKILWLVVPFLLACVIYYALYPLAQRLILAGMAQEQAAAWVAGSFTFILTGVLLLFSPLLASKGVMLQELVDHYLDGGQDFLEKTLSEIESSAPFFSNAHLSDKVHENLTSFTDNFAQAYLIPFLMTAAGWLPSLLLAPLVSFFMLRDGQKFKRFLLQAVPNAFFERTLHLVHEVNQTAKAYFQGMMVLTVLDALTLGIGLWLLGMTSPLTLGIITAVLAWVPFVGSVVGCILVVLVAAADFPAQPGMAYGAIVLFIVARMLDDFLYMPMTVGRKLKMHPLITVLLIFIGGAIAGITGLMLVLPLAGIVMVIGQTIGGAMTDMRLRARHLHGVRLRRDIANRDL
jgi:predicted PurR-regulated permease PerM